MFKQLLMLAATLLLLPLIVFSQGHYEPGYVVTGNDTVTGYLKNDVESNLLNGVNFSNNISGSANRFYTTNDITAFYFNNGNLFRLVKFSDPKNETHQYFVKVLLKGYYNLYAYRKSDILYFIITNNDSTYLLYDDKYLTSGALDERGNYKQRLLFLSVGCTGVSKSEDLQYNENDLIDFIKKLNACHEPSATSTVLYVKPKSKANFYVYAAAMPLGDNSEYAARASARFTLPSISKSTSLNVGIVYMSHNSSKDVYSGKFKRIQNIISGGLTMQYNFLTGTVQPYIEAGVGFAHQTDNDPFFDPIQKSGLSLIAAVGIEAYITKNVAIKADWRYELFTHYPVVGIAYFINDAK